ncbi:MAG: hypothetical protein WAW86_02615 [Gammaproteobacteria bacterium]
MASSRKIVKALANAEAREKEPLLDRSNDVIHTDKFDLLPTECFQHLEKFLDSKSFFYLASSSKKMTDRMRLNESSSKKALTEFVAFNKRYNAIEREYKHTFLANTGRIILSAAILGLAILSEVLICLEGENFNNFMRMAHGDLFRSAIYVVGSFVCGLMALAGLFPLFYVEKLSLLSDQKKMYIEGNRVLWNRTLNEVINPVAVTWSISEPASDDDLDRMEWGLPAKRYM